jgi:hypothetical protein
MIGAKPWDRLLWGVVFTSHKKDDDPVLIGQRWAHDLGHVPYLGEPSRPLLFDTRQSCRDWCAKTMLTWSGRDTQDIIAQWSVRPVRVREIQRIEVYR